jgi:hypothetical protein
MNLHNHDNAFPDESYFYDEDLADEFEIQRILEDFEKGYPVTLTACVESKPNSSGQRLEVDDSSLNDAPPFDEAAIARHMNDIRKGRSLILNVRFEPRERKMSVFDWDGIHKAEAARRCKGEVEVRIVDDPDNPGYLRRVREAEQRLMATGELRYGEVEEEFDEEDGFADEADESEIRRYMNLIRAGHPLILTSLLEPGNRQTNPKTSCKGLDSVPADDDEASLCEELVQRYVNDLRQGRSLTLQMGVYPLHQGPPTLDWENRHIAAAARRCDDEVVARLIDDPNNPGFLERVSEAMRRLRLSSETD